jgi:hypothetical protein
MLFRCFWFLVIVVSGSTVALSQVAPGDKLPLSGVALDQNGFLIVGADVELRKDELLIRTAKTNEIGRFRFEGIITGNYEIRVTSPGFEEAIVDVKVEASSTNFLTITLFVVTIRQAVTISTDRPQLNTDPADNKNAISAPGDFLETIPVLDQDYIATLSRFIDPASVGTSGVSLIVNGVEENSLKVSPSAIKEIRINQDPYSAEFPRPGQGRIEVVTKPGGSTYHGAFNLVFRDAHLNARDTFALTRPAEQRRIYEGIFSGPLSGSKKTSFLISATRNEDDVQSVIFARGLDRIIQANVDSPVRNFLIAGEVARAATPKSSFSIRYSFQNRSLRNQGIGGSVIAEAGTNSRFREHQINFSQQRIFSSKLVNEFRLLLGNFDWPTASVMGGRKVVVADSFVGGGAQNDQLHTEYHFALTEILSHTRGKHVIKTGINVPDWSRRGANYAVNFGGTFFFSNLLEFRQGKPFSFTLQQGDPHLVFIEKVIGGFIQDEYKPRGNLLLAVGVRYDWQNYFQDSNNFAPRFSFAYAPGKSQQVVFRGGAGIFYDRTGPRPILETQLFDGARIKQFVVRNPSFPDPFAGTSLTEQPVSATRLSREIRIPYLFQYSVSAEHEIMKSTTLAITYIGSSGISLLRSRDINAPMPPNYQQRRNPSLGVLREIQSAGNSRRNALELTLRGELSRYFRGTIQYRLARHNSDTEGWAYLPPNSYDLSGEWSRANEDRRHRLDLLGTVDAGKFFRVGVVWSLNTGAPYSITTGRDDFNTGTANARPDGIRRNSEEGPGYATLDLRWSRDFFIDKARKDKGPTITIAVDGFNVLNRANLNNFVGNLSSPFFGRAVSAKPARRVQLSGRLRF